MYEYIIACISINNITYMYTKDIIFIYRLTNNSFFSRLLHKQYHFTHLLAQSHFYPIQKSGSDIYLTASFFSILFLMKNASLATVSNANTRLSHSIMYLLRLSKCFGVILCVTQFWENIQQNNKRKDRQMSSSCCYYRYCCYSSLRN